MVAFFITATASGRLSHRAQCCLSPRNHLPKRTRPNARPWLRVSPGAIQWIAQGCAALSLYYRCTIAVLSRSTIGSLNACQYRETAARLALWQNGGWHQITSQPPV